MDLSLRTYGQDGEDEGLYDGYVKHLNDVHQEIVARNPSGWADEFESRIQQHAVEAANRQGTHARVEHGEDGTTIHVYGTRAARTYGIVPGNYRSDSEEAASKLQRNQFWEQMNKNAEDRLMRGAKRMHEAGIHQDLSAGGDFTIDPDAEDPKDIYRPA
jgi:hypothetical protein